MKRGLYSQQRVGVFIDVQNMYYSAKNLHDSKVDYSNILDSAVQGRKLIRAIAYVIKADISEEKDFFDALDRIGYEVKAKELKVFHGGDKKGDWDMGIAIDVVELADKIDAAVLVSGDGDFIHLINHLKAKGVRTEVMAFGRSAARELKDNATNFIDMDKKKDKFLI